MKYETKDTVLVKENDILEKECIIIGYTLFEGKITYRLLDPIKQECFDLSEDEIIGKVLQTSEKRILS
jgi:hypothetical protein